MPCKTISLEAVATIGIDIGKNTFHLIGLDKMGAIVLRQKLSRNQVPTRRPQSSQPSRGRDRGVEACERGIMRVAIVAIIVSALCVAAQAQEVKPCPSGHICPVCTDQDGIRSCKVERPGQQPELPQAAAPPLDISPSSDAALPPSPPPPRPVFRLGPFVLPLR